MIRRFEERNERAQISQRDTHIETDGEIHGDTRRERHTERQVTHGHTEKLGSFQCVSV